MVNRIVNILNHPNVWIFSLVLTIINAVVVGACMYAGNIYGASLNSIFLVVNTAGLFGNFLFRKTRVKMQEDMKAERRQHLIRLTIGED